MLFIPGNAVIGQSGGPSAAINATLCGAIQGMLEHAPDCRLYGMRNGIEGLLDERLIDLTDRFTLADGQTPDAASLELLSHTPAAALGSCRRKLPDQGGNDTAVYERMIAIFKKYDITTFFYIGGNDSMDTVAKLSAYTRRVGYPMCVIGIPKTIDNDLPRTDHSPGFGSAAKYVATVMQEILLDCAVYTVPAVTIVEIMGRDAGWLATAASLGAHQPDYIYLPERSFSVDSFIKDVRAALEIHPNVVIAVSEGIRFADGTPVGLSVQSGGQATDVFGHRALAGAAKALEFAVQKQIGCKVRSIELNLPQRCAAHLLSQADIEESLRTGRAAVEAAKVGKSEIMMVIERESNAPYRSRIGCASILRIANGVRHVPPNFINSRGNHVSNECRQYLIPLIRGEVSLPWQDGIPSFFRFD